MDKQIKIGFTHQMITGNCIKNFECNRVTFINQGTQNVVIDGVLTLAPADSITYPPDFPNEHNETVYNINFTNDQLPGCILVAVVKNIMSR